jgi:anti-sigma factor RsiW
MEAGEDQVTCSRELIEGYMDRELDLNLNAQVEEHLAACPECSATYARLREQQAAIRSEAPYYPAPVSLERSVRAAVMRASAEEFEKPRPSTAWRWLALAAILLTAISLGLTAYSQLRSRASERELLAQNIISSHVRSTVGTHLLDVVSTDQHTVKPWFSGKLDFSPNVKDLAADGFPLIGGRVDYVSDRVVAALVFKRRQHVINLFTWPSKSDTKESQFERNGYNVLQWTDGSMTYWAVSDVGPADLRLFRDLYKK